MKANEIILETINSGPWYHGSGMDFKEFDVHAAPINRNANPPGIYLTTDKEEAEEYAAGLFDTKPNSNKNSNGVVYVVNIIATNPYIDGKSFITDNMIDVYSIYLKKHYAYGKGWVDDVIIPRYKKDGRFKDIPGDIKTKIYQAGGYDSWKDGRHLVVFNSSNIIMINKYKVKRKITEEPLVKTDGPMGLTQYQNSSFVLNGGFRSGSSSAGTTRLRYQIFDMKIFDPKQPEAAEVGLVDLFVDDQTGDIVGLVNIEFKPKFRRSGRGRQLITDLKDTIKTGFNIHDVQKKAKGFWKKMGIKYSDAAKQNGRIESIKENNTTRDDDIQHILSMVRRMI